MTEGSLEGFLSVRESADFLDVSTTAVYRLIGRGKLASVYRGGVHFIRKGALRNLLEDKQYQEMRRRALAKRSEPTLDLGGLADGA